MPKSRLGQMITFSIELDEDQRRTGYIWIDVVVGDTVRKIAARRGHPEEAAAIAKLNKIRSTATVIRHKPLRKRGDFRRVRVPGQLQQADVFHVLAGDNPPTITTGYAKIETVDRPQRTGITMFKGYDPIQMNVPIRFDRATGRSPHNIERDIDLLERMAGRGNIPGAAVGPPAIIRVSTTDSSGQLISLIADNYQWSPQNPSAPLWRIANIEWDENALRDRHGNRTRQLATVILQQNTRVSLAVRSVAKRSKDKKKTSKKKPVVKSRVVRKSTVR